MPLTIILAILAIIGLGIIFWAAYKVKGLKIAFLTSGIALIVFVVLYVVTVYAITSAM